MNGRVEGWKIGRVEEWKIGRVEGWKSGGSAPTHSSILPFFHSSSLAGASLQYPCSASV